MLEKVEKRVAEQRQKGLWTDELFGDVGGKGIWQDLLKDLKKKA